MLHGLVRQPCQGASAGRLVAAVEQGDARAQIEAAVKAGLLIAFMDSGREVTTADLITASRSIRPTSVVKREEIEELRRWAREHLATDAGDAAAPATGERLMEF